jgi:four helix bundle protein
MDELFEAWLRRQSDALRADTLWKMESYRHALYLVDLAKADVGLATAAEHASLRGQLLTAVISISANIAEGYSRPTLADRARFFSYALGSARESFSWYLGLQGIIGDQIVRERFTRLERIRRMLIATLRSIHSRLPKKAFTP